MRNTFINQILVVVAMTLLFGCKTPRRASTVAGPSQELMVRIINMQSDDRKNPNINVELTRCQGSDVLPGKINEEGYAVFSIKGAKAGSVCELRVLYPAAPSSQYLFLSEPGLLYLARNVVLTQTVTGKLDATAILEKKYNLNLPVDPGKSFTIVADVEFPEDVSASALLLNAQLACDPAIATVASAELGGTGRAGKFSFPAVIQPGVSAHLCKAINVFVNGTWVYQGKMNNGEGRPVKPLPDGTVAIENAPIKLVKLSQVQSSGVSVQTVDGGMCPNGEVFDVRLRKCVPNSNTTQQQNAP